MCARNINGNSKLENKYLHLYEMIFLFDRRHFVASKLGEKLQSRKKSGTVTQVFCALTNVRISMEVMLKKSSKSKLKSFFDKKAATNNR